MTDHDATPGGPAYPQEGPPRADTPVQPTAAYVSGPWWGRSIETISGRKVVGVAIRYKR